MKASVFERAGQPLRVVDMPVPAPGPHQTLLRVKACGVCRTDLHILDGELPDPKLPLVPGHQIIGTIEQVGDAVDRFAPGDRVGVPWLGSTCGTCAYCRDGRENLCDNARFTGYHIDGGFAEYTAADERFCFPLPGGYPDTQAAPLLCGGLIGYRSFRMCGEARRIGFYGFGSAAHIIVQVATYLNREVYAFTRPGNREGQEFARRMGAVWAGDSDTLPPELLDAAIIFAPVGGLVPHALKAVRKGGAVVCAGIYMSDIPSVPYELLWNERELRSVANLTRRDGEEFLRLAPRVPVHTEITTYPLEQAQQALDDLRNGRVSGSAVITVS